MDIHDTNIQCIFAGKSKTKKYSNSTKLASKPASILKTPKLSANQKKTSSYCFDCGKLTTDINPKFNKTNSTRESKCCGCDKNRIVYTNNSTKKSNIV